MADLSFIEDSVAFPEKEEDEEEEEEGVEWGYEEGNRSVLGWPGSRDGASEVARRLCPERLRALHASALARCEHLPPRPRFPTWGSVSFPVPGPVSGQRAGRLPPCASSWEPGLPVGRQLAPASIRSVSHKVAGVTFLSSE